MMIRHASLLVAAVLIPATAFAASQDDILGKANPAMTNVKTQAAYSRYCVDLQAQFDKAAAKQMDASKITPARKVRDEGAAACNRGDVIPGSSQLQQALKEIGVKPHPQPNV